MDLVFIKHLVVAHIPELPFEDIRQHRLNFGRNLNETVPSSLLRGRLWPSDNTALKIPVENRN